MDVWRVSQERVFDDVSIVLVGKYTDLQDSYMSVTKSLEHSAFRCSRKLILKVPFLILLESPDHGLCIVTLLMRAEVG